MSSVTRVQKHFRKLSDLGQCRDCYCQLDRSINSLDTRTRCRKCADRRNEDLREKRFLDPYYGHPLARRQAEEFNRSQLDRIPPTGLTPVTLENEES